MSFVHLHVQSAFSFLFGSFTPEALAEHAHKNSVHAVALTDTNGLYGAVRFYRAASRYNIKPILGAKLPFHGNFPLVFLAKSFEGYSNLCRLITTLHLSEWEQECSFEMLERYKHDLFLLTGGRNGNLWNLVSRRMSREAENFLGKLKDIFQDFLFVEIQNHWMQGDSEIAGILHTMATRLKLSTIATNSVAYLAQEDYSIHKVLISIQKAVHHKNISTLPNNQFYFKTEKEMKDAIPYKDAIENTGDLADMCHIKLPPETEPFREDNNTHQTLANMCYSQLARNYKPTNLSVLKRLAHELSVIKKAGLSQYLLTVKDICNFAKERNITVMGRVPFDPAFTKAMVQGKTIVEFDGRSKGCEAVKNIWENLAQDLEI